ncbi:MAG TPA: nucleoside phosphorylase [Ilumatobacteraceae bacterium]|nr:nucleoside phosphorylase [Ilumatobacteraceae bacterium]HQZ37174.1 nucleoside phosphorylase [Ilumatobacteraceae bacterium]
MEQADDQHHFHIPLTEHDVARTAFIEPSQTISPQDVPSACVITFFGDVVDRLVERRGARVLSQNRWEDGPHPLLEIEHDGKRLAVLRSGVGAPLAGGLLEETIAMGCRAFVVCGGAGTLHGELTLGHFVVVASAIRDEGTSYHYLPPSRTIQFDEDARRVLEGVLEARGVPFVVGRTWTTDAPYRETASKIAARRAEGCLTVEMEASALAAIASFRRVPLAQVVYCGDDLAGDSWDHRSWQDLSDVREDLFDLAASAAVTLSRSASLAPDGAPARR